ncbi:hypothetical protein B0H14DRAFT_3487812 [Mycena olivaceomarginata]|nr:hypothetical protein B0H14DRAFT_3487812 [Mycena olivaceomarginata]
MSGPGAHFTSPQKPRDPKNQTVVRGFGTAARAAALRERIEARKNPGRASAPSEPAPLSANVADPQDDVQMPDWVDVPSEIPKIPHSSFLPPTLVPAPSSPRNTTRRQCAAWDLLLPELERPYAHYQLSSYAQRPLPIPSVIRFECPNSCPTSLVTQIQCLYISCK